MYCLNRLAEMSPKGQLTDALEDVLQNQPLVQVQGEQSPLSQCSLQGRYPRGDRPVTVRRLEPRGAAPDQFLNRPVYGSAIAQSLAHLTGQSPQAMGLTLMTQIKTSIKAQVESQNLETQGRVFPEFRPAALDANGMALPQEGPAIEQSPLQSPSIWSLVDVTVNPAAGLVFSFTHRGMILWFQWLERQVVVGQGAAIEERTVGDRPMQPDSSRTVERGTADIIWFSQYAHARCAAMLRLLLESGFVADSSPATRTTINDVDVHALEELWWGGDRPSLYAQSVDAVLGSVMMAADVALEGSAGPTAQARLISAMDLISHAILQFQARFPPLGTALMQARSAKLENLQVRVGFALTQVTQKILHLLLVNAAGAIAPYTL